MACEVLLPHGLREASLQVQAVGPRAATTLVREDQAVGVKVARGSLRIVRDQQGARKPALGLNAAGRGVIEIRIRRSADRQLRPIAPELRRYRSPRRDSRSSPLTPDTSHTPISSSRCGSETDCNRVASLREIDEPNRLPASLTSRSRRPSTRPCWRPSWRPCWRPSLRPSSRASSRNSARHLSLSLSASSFFSFRPCLALPPTYHSSERSRHRSSAAGRRESRPRTPC